MPRSEAGGTTLRAGSVGDRIAVLLVVLLPLALFGHALLPGRVLAPVDLVMTAYPWRALAPDVVPANMLLTDVAYLVHPLLLWGAREVGEGRLPLWNPHLFAGAPYLANPHTAVFFPLTWLTWLLPAAPALTLHAIGKLALVGAATYWCGRVLELGRGAALLGAVAFMLSGPVVVWLHWPYTTTMAFLPALVGLVERVRSQPGPRGVALLALAVALALFAGYPQGALWGLLVAAVWALARARGAPGGPLAFGARVSAGVALGGLLAAVQVLPFLEYARESAVVAYRAQWMPFLSLPGRAAVTWLVPFFFGGVRDFRGDFTFNAVTLTVGLVPWVTLPVALAVAWRRPATRVLVGLALGAAALVYGAPWLGPGLAALPIVGWSLSLRVAPVLSFALAMLGAVGLDALASAGAEVRARVAGAVTGAVALLAAAVLAAGVTFPDFRLWPVLAFLAALTLSALVVLRSLRRPAERLTWAGVLLAIEIGTLAPVALAANAAADAAWLYPEPPVLRALRTASAADQSRVLLGQHNLAMLYGLSDPTGHDGLTPAHLEAIAGPLGTGRTIGTLGSEPLAAGAVFDSGTVDLLGVRWFVVPPQAGPPRPTAALRYAAADARVYENPHALPRAFLAPAGRCVSEAESRARVRTGPAQTDEVVLTGDCAGAPPGAVGGAVGTAAIRQHAPDRVTVTVAGSTPAYLVLTDTWFPGWRVTVDGTEQRIFRAAHAFRAVWIPAGEHVVEFRYRPASVAVGALLSGLAVVVVVGLLALGRRGRRAAAAAALLVATLGARDAAALEPMPLALAAPSRAEHLEVVRLAVEPGRGAVAAAAPVDLYLVWAFRPDARFIGPDGAWTSEPVPVRRGVRLAELAPFALDWRAAPVGAISLALVAVTPGSHPVDRASWVWSPALSWVEVRAPRALDRRAGWRLAGVGLAALGCVVGVWVYARRQ